MKIAQGRGPQSLRRGMAILTLLKQVAPDGIGASQIASCTGIQRSTVHRLLDALEDSGWVIKSKDGTRHLVDRLAGLPYFDGCAIDTHVPRDLMFRAIPAMRRLAQKFGDTVFLVSRDKNESISIHREIGNYPVQVVGSYPGDRYPLGVGSAGMALLAALPEDEATSIVSHNAEKLKEYGGLNPALILRLRSSALERGYAAMQNYVVKRALGVGCAMSDSSGRPIIAMSVSSVIDRMPSQRQTEIASAIRKELDLLASIPTPTT